jgi:hypothetical protein
MRPTDLSDKRLPGTKHTGPVDSCNLARIWGFQLLSQNFPTIIASFSLPLVCAGSRTRRSMNGHLSPGTRAHCPVSAFYQALSIRWFAWFAFNLVHQLDELHVCGRLPLAAADSHAQTHRAAISFAF